MKLHVKPVFSETMHMKCQTLYYKKQQQKPPSIFKMSYTEFLLIRDLQGRSIWIWFLDFFTPVLHKNVLCSH